MPGEALQENGMIHRVEGRVYHTACVDCDSNTVSVCKQYELISNDRLHFSEPLSDNDKKLSFRLVHANFKDHFQCSKDAVPQTRTIPIISMQRDTC